VFVESVYNYNSWFFVDDMMAEIIIDSYEKLLGLLYILQ